MRATVSIFPPAGEEYEGLSNEEANRKQVEAFNLKLIKFESGSQDDDVTVEGAFEDLERYIKEVGWDDENTGGWWYLSKDSEELVWCDREKWEPGQLVYVDFGPSLNPSGIAPPPMIARVVTDYGHAVLVDPAYDHMSFVPAVEKIFPGMIEVEHKKLREIQDGTN